MAVVDNSTERAGSGPVDAAAVLRARSTSDTPPSRSSSSFELVRTPSGTVHVFDGSRYRPVADVLAGAMIRTLGAPRPVLRLDARLIGLPIEVLDTGHGPLWAVIGAVRFEIRGFPRPTRVDSVEHHGSEHGRTHRLVEGVSTLVAGAGSGFRRRRVAPVLDALAIWRS